MDRVDVHERECVCSGQHCGQTREIRDLPEDVLQLLVVAVGERPRKCPRLEGARILVKTLPGAPACSRFMSSKLSAPGNIPATIEEIFVPGFAPPIATRSSTSSPRPACSARAMAGTKPESASAARSHSFWLEAPD
ncbi:hypothetical protein GCM10022223_43250 [Kineosporia mesophila]|uniref:Uncharacterized protein n=1 Tax=Kineosporia mesophila TaxID=566012 RepID=A0ABP6ZWU0_9ACTN